MAFIQYKCHLHLGQASFHVKPQEKLGQHPESVCSANLSSFSHKSVHSHSRFCLPCSDEWKCKDKQVHGIFSVHPHPPYHVQTTLASSYTATSCTNNSEAAQSQSNTQSIFTGTEPVSGKCQWYTCTERGRCPINVSSSPVTLALAMSDDISAFRNFIRDR